MTTTLPSQLTKGADHSASNDIALIAQLIVFIARARKAVVAFLAAGGGATLGEGIATFDFTNLSLENLWTGLGVGLVSGFIVYMTSNRKPAG